MNTRNMTIDEICALVNSAIEVMNKQNINQWDDLYPIREDFQEDIEKNQLEKYI